MLSDKGGANPLLDLFQGRGASAFALAAAIAVANGVLVEFMMLARLFYGMALTVNCRTSSHPSTRGRGPPYSRLFSPVVSCSRLPCRFRSRICW